MFTFYAKFFKIVSVDLLVFILKKLTNCKRVILRNVKIYLCLLGRGVLPNLITVS